jgi:hypothetical protein
MGCFLPVAILLVFMLLMGILHRPDRRIAGEVKEDSPPDADAPKSDETPPG